jgi:hAT family C-terminal dimerisation region
LVCFLIFNADSDYVFFAYDSLFNRIKDITNALALSMGLGALPCAGQLLTGLKAMELTLKEYYEHTALPTVYGDAMILNSRCKLSTFGTSTWDGDDTDVYSDACRSRFLDEYYTGGSLPNDDTLRQVPKCGAANDPEFNAVLEQRSAKRLKNDYDRYISLPNEVTLTSSLDWYRKNYLSFSDLGKMARDMLAVPASGSAVERVFSVSGRIATWQHNRMSAETISNLMMFKYGLKFEKWKVPDTMSGELS